MNLIGSVWLEELLAVGQHPHFFKVPASDSISLVLQNSGV